MLVNSLQTLIWIEYCSYYSLASREWIVLAYIISIVIFSRHSILFGPKCIHISHYNITVLFHYQVFILLQLVELQFIFLADLAEVISDVVAYLVNWHFVVAITQCEFRWTDVDTVRGIALLTLRLVVEVLIQYI